MAYLGFNCSRLLILKIPKCSLFIVSKLSEILRILFRFRQSWVYQKKMKSEQKHEKGQSNFGMAGLGKYCNHYFKNHASWDTLYIMKIYLSSIYTLLVWMFVCLWPINVETAKPIGPKFFLGPQRIPGKI